MSLSYRTSGNSRSYEFRPSDHTRIDANRMWKHGARSIQPMEYERPSLLARIFRRNG